MREKKIQGVERSARRHLKSEEACKNAVVAKRKRLVKCVDTRGGSQQHGSSAVFNRRMSRVHALDLKTAQMRLAPEKKAKLYIHTYIYTCIKERKTE
jgi:hypothetical protein